MGKYQPHVYRKDSVLDHVHVLPDGKETGGMTMKPNGLHAHLYQHEGHVLETGLGDASGDHVHDAHGGHTSGPQTKGSKGEEPGKAPVSQDQHGVVGGVEANSRMDSTSIRYRGATIFYHQYANGDWEAYVHKSYLPHEPRFTGKSKKEVIAECEHEIDVYIAKQKHEF